MVANECGPYILWKLISRFKLRLVWTFTYILKLKGESLPYSWVFFLSIDGKDFDPGQCSTSRTSCKKNRYFQEVLEEVIWRVHESKDFVRQWSHGHVTAPPHKADVAKCVGGVAIHKLKKLILINYKFI